MRKISVSCRCLSSFGVMLVLFMTIGPWVGPSVGAQATSSNSESQTGLISSTPPKKGGLWSKLVANAQYQQAKQNGDPNANNYLPQDAGGGKDSKKKHLCNINDSGVSLQPDGSWSGPNCITSDGNGHAKNPDDIKDDKSKDSSDTQAKVRPIWNPTLA